MLPRFASEVDDDESAIPTPRRSDPAGEATVTDSAPMRAIPEESAIFARGSRRALYVPSPLPMCELKKTLAQADDEVTHDSSPPRPSEDEGPPSSAPTRLHREPTPFELAKTSLDHAQHRRASRNVDADEEEASPGWHDVVPPLPALEEFAPIVGAYADAPSVLPVPGAPLAPMPSMAKNEMATTKRGGIGAGVYVGTLIVAGILGIAIVRGDVTRDDARGVAAAVSRAASHVVEIVKPL